MDYIRRALQSSIVQIDEISKRCENQFSPLHQAAEYLHYDIVEVLLEAGADRMKEDHKGNLALHLLVGHGDCPEKTLKYILNYRGPDQAKHKTKK